jgi:GWxTD domain-containing protein
MSVHRYIFLSFLLVSGCLVYGEVQASSPDSARVSPGRGNRPLSAAERKGAIEALEKALDQDRHRAETHAELTELYLQEGTLTGRIEAERHIHQAVKIDPDNARYQVQYGMVKRMQGFRHAAKRKFTKALELDPNCADAYYNLGVLSDQEVWHFRDMVDGPIHFDHFAEKDELQSIDYFRKALRIDPNHRNALFHLGLVYCEQGEFENMAGLCRRMLKNDPDDKDARLFHGLALYRQGRGREAWEEYTVAKELMGEDERAVFESIESLLSPDEEKQYLAASFEERDRLASRFWHRQDPLFLTDYNERILEHYSRVAYANLRYGFPDKGIGGWETDQGKVYIRYGSPLFRTRTRPSIEPGERNPVQTSIEVWRYGDFDHVFEDMLLTGQYRFKWGSRPETDGLSKFNSLIKEVPQTFDYDYGGQRFTVPCALASFRGEKGKTSVDLCYALPAKYLDYTVKQHESRVSVEIGAFFFDDGWQSVLRDVGDEELVTERIDPLKEYDVVSQRTVLVEPGEYHFALEVRDKRSENIGFLRDTVVVKGYGFEKLQLSDVLFATDIQPITGEDAFRRGEFQIVPHPTKRYSPSQPVFIYYEIYNLQPDVFGQTHYVVEYIIGPEPEPSRGLSKLFEDFGDLIGARRRKGLISATSENKGRSTTEHKFLRIDISDVPPDATVLTLHVRDLNSKQEIEEKSRFLILE